MRSSREAFTLMEILVSVFLLTLIVMFLYGSIGTLQHSNRSLGEHDALEQNRTRLYRLIFDDIVRASSVNLTPTSDKHFTVVELRTANTLYEIAEPYVTYFVHANELTLVRLESASKIVLPLTYESQNLVFADALMDEMESFNVYASSKTAVAPSGSNVADEQNQTEAGQTEQNASQPAALGTYLIHLKSKKMTIPMLFEIGI